MWCDARASVGIVAAASSSISSRVQLEDAADSTRSRLQIGGGALSNATSAPGILCSCCSDRRSGKLRVVSRRRRDNARVSSARRLDLSIARRVRSRRRAKRTAVLRGVDIIITRARSSSAQKHVRDTIKYAYTYGAARAFFRQCCVYDARDRSTTNGRAKC